MTITRRLDALEASLRATNLWVIEWDDASCTLMMVDQLPGEHVADFLRRADACAEHARHGGKGDVPA